MEYKALKEAFERFDYLYKSKKILELTTLALNMPTIFNLWRENRGFVPGKDGITCLA